MSTLMTIEIREHLALLEADLDGVKARVKDLDDGQLEILRLLAENTRVTQRVSADTTDLIEFFVAMRGAFKVMSWIGALARPVGAVIGLFTSLLVAWAAFKGWFEK